MTTSFAYCCHFLFFDALTSGVQIRFSLELQENIPTWNHRATPHTVDLSEKFIALGLLMTLHTPPEAPHGGDSNIPLDIVDWAAILGISSHSLAFKEGAGVRRILR